MKDCYIKTYPKEAENENLPIYGEIADVFVHGTQFTIECYDSVTITIKEDISGDSYLSQSGTTEITIPAGSNSVTCSGKFICSIIGKYSIKRLTNPNINIFANLDNLGYCTELTQLKLGLNSEDYTYAKGNIETLCTCKKLETLRILGEDLVVNGDLLELVRKYVANGKNSGSITIETVSGQRAKYKFDNQTYKTEKSGILSWSGGTGGTATLSNTAAGGSIEYTATI